MNTDYNKITKVNNIEEKLKELENYQGSNIPENIPQGDMPGDPVWIGEEMVKKTNVLFPKLVKEVQNIINNNPYQRVVIAITGGSGVGKTCIASLCSYYFMSHGIGSYTLSGDNYPRRIPEYNDAERLHIFREKGIHSLVKSGAYNQEVSASLKQLQEKDLDSNPKYIEQYPWLETYISGGKEGLRGYLGTKHEICFQELDSILSAFKDGADSIWLKRMGRDETSLWYEKKDFTNINVLIVEWTHGNSDDLKNVDIPVLLNSTPSETMAYRKARNRDGNADSPFVTMVLEIEQRKLFEQSKKAKIIVSKSLELLSYDEYLERMKEINDE